MSTSMQECVSREKRVIWTLENNVNCYQFCHKLFFKTITFNIIWFKYGLIGFKINY